MSTDLLDAARWTCAALAPGTVDEPASLAAADARWLPVEVPGTAAAAVRAADGVDAAEAHDFDADDWWFRTTFSAESGAAPHGWTLSLDGLATVSDVWLNGTHVHHGDSMFAAATVTVDELAATNELVIRCAALAPLLAEKRPRPRWRTRLIEPQNLRWFRTSALGRMPGWSGTAAPVGPWRPVALTPRAAVEVVHTELTTSVEGRDGVVTLRLHIDRHAPTGSTTSVSVGEVTVDVDVPSGSGEIDVVVTVPDVELWWPHTHGAQPLYPVRVVVDGVGLDLGTVGFRTIEVDRTDGAFTVSVNRVPVFCRGACWTPLDPIALAVEDDAYDVALRQVVDGGMNTLRVTGTSVYESPAFWAACDRLGILVWQDAMLATLDPPEDDDFLAILAAEIEELARSLQTHPSLAVFSGGSETEQQATMFGLDADRRRIRALEATVPAALGRVLPGVPYVTSTPSGGDLPTHGSRGVAHYFGVGGYRRPLHDARRANVRFAAECLAFSTPPERSSDAAGNGNAPRDNGASWDFADVTDFYVGDIFGLDPATVGERLLDLRRAAVAHAMAETMTEWRRGDSSCDGALVLTLRDLAPGAGWGLVDHAGDAKAPWFTLRRVFAPRTALVTDEGLDGLAIHVLNDAAEQLSGRLQIELYGMRGHVADELTHEVSVGGHSSLRLSLDGLLGAFRDVTYAYRFGEPTYDAARVRLLDADGTVLSDEVRLVRGEQRDRVDNVGLTATAEPADGRAWTLTVATRDLAQWVVIDLPGFVASDSWFHLAPGTTRVITLTPRIASDLRVPAGDVRALNAVAVAPVVATTDAAVAS